MYLLNTVIIDLNNSTVLTILCHPVPGCPLDLPVICGQLYLDVGRKKLPKTIVLIQYSCHCSATPQSEVTHIWVSSPYTWVQPGPIIILYLLQCSYHTRHTLSLSPLFEVDHYSLILFILESLTVDTNIIVQLAWVWLPWIPHRGCDRGNSLYCPNVLFVYVHVLYNVWLQVQIWYGCQWLWHW